jgi:hypothetical protein
LVGSGNPPYTSEQGESVALSADGNTAVIGAVGFAGAVWAFTRNAGIWKQQGPSLQHASPVYSIDLGNSVSVSADGNNVIAGEYQDYFGVGALWMLTRSDTYWTSSGPEFTVPSGGGTGELGLSTCLSADGNTVIAGGFCYSSTELGAWVFMNNSSLPLNLLSFTGYTSNNINHLQWTTAVEVGTKDFSVERSTNGNNFTSIAIVNAKGAGSGIYNYYDPISDSRMVYYRLKMIDIDGNFTYSFVIHFTNQSNNHQISIYPDPVKDKTTLQINDNTLLGTTTKLMDASGRIGQTFTINNIFQIVDMSLLPQGLYFLQTANGNTQTIMKE